jgi:hypothetical protein
MANRLFCDCMLPLEEYESRVMRWRTQHDMLQRQFIRIGNWRLITGILIAGVAWLTFGAQVISAWVLLVPVVSFVCLVVWHAGVMRRRRFAQRAVDYYEAGLARLQDKWPGAGNPGERFRNAFHPYAEDLDVFGRGSLFELVCSARTKAGEDTLAAWLLDTAAKREVLARQQSVDELRSQVDLREQIALLGEEVKSELDIEATERWATAPPAGFHPLLRPAALVLAIAGVACVIAFFAQWIPLWPLLLVLACDFMIIFAVRAKVSRVGAAVDTPAQSLRLVSLLLQKLEEQTFNSPKLQALSSDVSVDGTPASKRIARLERWMDWLDSGENVFVRVLRPILLWREQIVMGIEKWREENGSLAVAWIKRLGEFEALSSFASLAFERPDWQFPALTETDMCWRADGLRHPLLSSAACVPNDVTLGDGLQVLIVSGSNMSGKSTLLRSIGLNTVLAWAGAPVAAREMTLSCFQVATSMRVVDSLQDNRSRFYAEITRIRQIFDLVRSGRPVLFLLDELLSGTNSRDRLLGASGILRNLVSAGAVGLITTHDLALTDLERELGTCAANVHFDDRLADGQIEFDYKLKPGVVTHSNALALMRAIGIDV